MSVRHLFLGLAVLAVTAVPGAAFAQGPSDDLLAERAGEARQQAVIPRGKMDAAARKSALAFVRTELFFGTAKPDGEVTPEEFQIFLDDVVTPLFPDGLTVVKADGQFKGADGITIKEDSFVLILLYPLENRRAGSANIESIRTEYRKQHQQESVLRVDDPFIVWVRF